MFLCRLSVRRFTGAIPYRNSRLTRDHCVAKGTAVVTCPIPGVVTAWGRLLASLPLKMNTVGMEGRGRVWDNNRRCHDRMSGYFDSTYMQCDLRQSNKIYKYMSTDTSGSMLAGSPLVGVGRGDFNWRRGKWWGGLCRWGGGRRG